MSLTWIDNVFIMVIIISAVFGFVRGLFKEIISLLIWVLSFVIAARFAMVISDVLNKSFTHNKSYDLLNHESIWFAAGFVILFTVCLIIGSLIGFIFNQVLSKANMFGSNRYLGLIFGILRGILVCVIAMWGIKYSSIPETSAWSDSKLVPYIQPVAIRLRAVFPAEAQEYFEDTAGNVSGIIENKRQ